ncbi:MAG: hypothetical protein Crog4KO_34250 [Crocinitomicaceae bacterium]
MSKYKDTINWWEKRRLLYNAILIIYSAFCIYELWDYPVRGILGLPRIIFDTLGVFLFLNVVYTLLWAYDYWFYKHKTVMPQSSLTKKWVSFSLFTLFSEMIIDLHHFFQMDVLFAF